MKKLMYLIVAGFLFVFTACGGGANTEEAAVETTEEVAPAAAVAAHECGHAVQHATAYSWLQMRSQMVPMVNMSNKAMSTVFLLGIFGVSFLGIFSFQQLIMLFIILQAVVTAFTLITLPVEFDASRRALVWLRSSGITSEKELTYANDALKWAASTYVVAALAAATYLLYYVSMLRD